ncbi:MAG: peptide chain release factor N(5)-glutamine methyltransferase [Acidimicrobiales bacterium]
MAASSSRVEPFPEVTAVTWRELWHEAAAAIAEPNEARWLLEAATGRDAAVLLRELDTEAPAEAVTRVQALVQRRKAGEPLQHVLGHWGFRTLEVAVDSRALVPRPETEQVVAVALHELDRLRDLRSAANPTGSVPQLVAVDLGTGSGVIALSLVAERSALRVVATDRDPTALELAAANLSVVAKDAAARVELYVGDWYEAVPGDLKGRVDLVVANPPYVAEHEWAGLEEVVRDFDPYGALVAGPTGLEAIAVIVAGAPDWLSEGGALVTEIAPDQATRATELARGAGFGTAFVEDDLARRARVLVAR